MTDRHNWRKKLLKLGLWDQYQAELKELRARGMTLQQADEVLVPRYDGAVTPVTAVTPPAPPPQPTTDFDVDLRRDLKWVYANLSRRPDFSKAPSQGCEAMWDWAKENPPAFIKELLRQEPTRELNERAGDSATIDAVLDAVIEAESKNAVTPHHGRADDGVLPSGAQGTEGERGVSPESEDAGEE